MNLKINKDYNLREIFNNAEKLKRKNIEIGYIWYTPCEKCGELVPVLDDEYSMTISTVKDYLTLDECIRDLNRFLEHYDIYDEYLEENIGGFYYIGYNEIENTDVYYYYNEDRTQKEYCKICERFFKI